MIAFYPAPWPQLEPPLPASAIEYWHSERGIGLVVGGGAGGGDGVETWTGQLAGKVVTRGTARPVYAADGAYFKGRSVVQCTNVYNAALYNGSVSMFAAGSRPYTFAIFRYRSASNLQTICDCGSPTADAHMLSIGNGALNLGGFINGASATPNVVSSIAVGSGVRAAQLWCVGSDANIKVDSTLTTAVGSGGALAATTVAVGIGQNASGAFWHSLSSIAFVLHCASLPTAPEVAALESWARSYWGAP